MKQQNEKKWEVMNDLLAKIGPNLNILEEEVDLSVQKEYFEVIDTLSKEPEDYQALCKQYIESINDLFDENVDIELKKRMLIVLATIDDISIYRTIENFSKGDTPLKKWAIIALQQSRMLIQSTLVDDPEVFISTGLGGQGNLLRYFCVFLNQSNNRLQEFQQNIIKNETEAAIAPFKGIIEQIDFEDNYSSMLLLLPLDMDLKVIFEGIIDECNEYGHFLHENMIITNVKKLSHKEIQSILNGKNTKTKQQLE